MALPLTYHTKADSSTFGKKHIYLSAHPEDLKQHLEYICSLIYQNHNCVVSHLDIKLLPTIKASQEELQFLLQNANGIFVLITRRYLDEDSISSGTELPYLIRQRIPFLPLFLEPGLEDTFTQRFQSRHGIATSSTDSTSIPFQHKINTFLANTLGTAEENEQIRNAFQHRIFLSYRKKDRIRANAMIRRLHDDPRLDSTAVWFDEFLDPGSDFNEAIVQRIRESELVLFIVADSWLEKDNYIERIEYKETVKQGKPFYAIKFGHADNQLLEKQYPGLSTHFIPLSALLKKVQQTLRLPRSNGTQSAHDLYLLGLAYIRGYYVAINRDKGRRLLELAAKKKDPDAISTLAAQLSTGFFGTADPNTALKLYHEGLSIHKSLLSKTTDVDCVSSVFDCWDAIIKLYQAIGDEQSYLEETKKRLAFMEDYLHKKPSFQLAVLLLFHYNDYGDHCLDLFQTETAELYYTKMEHILEFIKDTPNLMYDPSDSDENNYDRRIRYEFLQVLIPYNRGLLAKDAQEHEQACTLFKQVEGKIKALDKLAHSATFRSLLSAVYQHLGQIYYTTNQHKNALSYLDKALKLVRLSIQEDPNQKSDYLLAIQIQRYQCATFFNSGKLKKAEQKTLELVKKCIQNEQQWHDDVSFNRETAQAMFLLGQIYQKNRQWLLAEKYYHDAFNRITTRKYHTFTDNDAPILSLIVHVSIDMYLMIIEETVNELPNDEDDYCTCVQQLSKIKECIDIMQRAHLALQDELLLRICRTFYRIGMAYKKQSVFTFAEEFFQRVLAIINTQPDQKWSEELTELWLDTASQYHEAQMANDCKLSQGTFVYHTIKTIEAHPELLQRRKCVMLLLDALIIQARSLRTNSIVSESSAEDIFHAYTSAMLYLLEQHQDAFDREDYLETKLGIYIFSCMGSSFPVRCFAKEALHIAQSLSAEKKDDHWPKTVQNLEILSKTRIFIPKLLFKKKALMGIAGVISSGFRKFDLVKFILHL